jgi:SSS family solute:Na+ symporter
MGRWSTVIGMLVSIGTAYLVASAASIMDYVQALFSFFIAPLFGTVVLGMLWKRATKAGGFWGLLAGTVSSIGMWIYTTYGGSAALSKIALSVDAKPMAETLYRALWAWLICVGVTVVVSLMTPAMSDERLAGLVYGATPIPDDGATTLWQKPGFWAIIVIIVFFILNIVFF